MHLPRKTVLWSASVFVLTLAIKSFYTAQTRVPGSELPWGWIVLLVGAFIAGQIIQDIFNPKSWVYLNWQALNRCVTANAFVATEQDPPASVIVVTLQATRDLKRLRVVGRGYSGIVTFQAPTLVVFAREEASGLAAGQSVRLVVGRVPHSHPGWTPEGMRWSAPAGQTPRPLAGNSKNIVEIEARSGWRHQKVRFQLRVANQHREFAARAFIDPDDADLF